MISFFFSQLPGFVIGVLAGVFVKPLVDWIWAPKLVINGSGGGASAGRPYSNRLTVVNWPYWIFFPMRRRASENVLCWLVDPENNDDITRLRWCPKDGQDLERAKIGPGESRGVHFLFVTDDADKLYICDDPKKLDPNRPFLPRKTKTYALKFYDNVHNLGKCYFTLEVDRFDKVKLRYHPTARERLHRFTTGLKDMASAFQIR